MLTEPALDAALRQATARTAALLRTVPDPTATAPGLTWTVAETAAHLVAEIEDYTGFAAGARDARDHLAPGEEEQTPSQRTAAANVRQLERVTERDLSRLAVMLPNAAEGFLAAGARRQAGDRILTANGLSMTVPTMTAALLGEQLVHGLDIARAAGSQWPITSEDALHVIGGVMAMVPDYVNREQTAGQHLGYELRLRGGPRYGLRIDDGTAKVTEADGKADCWISADPVTFMLVGYGRCGQWGQILRGKMIAGGRKPWLAASFGRLITGP